LTGSRGGRGEGRESCPLSTLREGERAVVVRIEGGEGVRKKLADMGILPGKEIGVTHGRGHGPRVVIVDQTKVMLGRGLLFKIHVEQQEKKKR
jgi:Fe2+ transport system protein FeoA